MKLIHLSDLHLGKRVNEYSMLDDQKYILDQILRIVDDEKPHGVLIAGDVYDRAVPSTEAVALLDDFLFRLADRETPVFLISGNHDSPERMAFAYRLIEKSGIHVSPVYDGTVTPLSLADEYGEVRFFMLPFLKPSSVRRFHEEEEIVSYTDAVRVAISHMPLDRDVRNVLVTHQFVTGAKRSESEEISVGGTDNVDASVFADFDYVALGHIHSPQSCETERVRYCGTPLKYSFSEVHDKKSVTVVELKEKGALSVRTRALTPLRDMHEIRGSYDELMQKSYYEHTPYREDYMHITLTDEEDIPDAVGKLTTVYHRLMKLDYDNARTRNGGGLEELDAVEEKSELSLFSDFYTQQNGAPMSEKQEAFITNLIREIWEGEQ
ncbi:MAG: exonuclease SbcCD subunit D [Clostridia bacterium]|nr:exonuclease SbcCD subunit D [Clostridia bacterium]